MHFILKVPEEFVLEFNVEIHGWVPTAVSNRSCKRSVSALRRLHTWLRRTKSQERLNDLAVLSVERESVEEMNEEMMIERVSQLKPRCFSLSGFLFRRNKMFLHIMKSQRI
ncbi:hypothetical protein ATANTOWER_008153 [Ataeniobius toweri]|uniref:Uncharacterized protein n=1 Tax=Ataeniobius toweri TaxID=208326 RepID=A0ABU7CJ50_9TELE|nr:hypothetical protein [Ataeniobius toweri]